MKRIKLVKVIEWSIKEAGKKMPEAVKVQNLEVSDFLAYSEPLDYLDVNRGLKTHGEITLEAKVQEPSFYLDEEGIFENAFGTKETTLNKVIVIDGILKNEKSFTINGHDDKGRIVICVLQGDGLYVAL